MASFIFNTGASVMEEHENLTSQVNGERTIFTVSKGFIPSSLIVYWQGSRQTAQFTVLNNTQFELNFAPPSGTKIDIDYYPL